MFSPCRQSVLLLDEQPNPRTAAAASAHCRNGIWPTSMPGIDDPRGESATSIAAMRESVAFEETYKGKLAATRGWARGGSRARRSGEALRGARRSARPARLVCRSRLRRRHRRSRSREIPGRRPGSPHGGLHCICCFSCSSSTGSTTPSSLPRCRAGARSLSAVARGHPQGQAVSARGPHRAAVSRKVGDCLFGLEPSVRRDHRRPAVQGRNEVARRSSRHST